LATYRGYGVEELVADLTVGLVSRALDDRQLTLHKQGRSFFHIAGAGHEALLVGLARSLRASYDWFFPYYRDLALCLALGITPYEVLLHSVGSADDLDSGGRQMPHHFGRADLNIVTQSSPTGSQCLPAIGCAEATRYIAGRELTGLAAHGDEITYVSIGEGATSEGEFWESLNTACRLQLNVLYLVADNGYAISVPSSDQAPAPISELVSGFPGTSHALTVATTSRAVPKERSPRKGSVQAKARFCCMRTSRDRTHIPHRTNNRAIAMLTSSQENASATLSSRSSASSSPRGSWTRNL
jgi:2-oxoisovalerate dehydrogenase E1 component